MTDIKPKPYVPKPGDRVRILINAGLCPLDEDRHFVGSAERGTTGVYRGPHEMPKLALEDWHWVEVMQDGEVLRAPLHIGQFELVEEPRLESEEMI